jgi:putative ABC transport system permease protein
VRFWYLRRRPDVVRSEIDEELNLHLELKADTLKSRGLSDVEARQEAVRSFGDLERTRRYCRQQDEQREATMQRALLFQDLVQDVRIAIRSLWRAPVLALTIVATVGIGMGATAAIFSAIDAALLRPLPYAQPDRLVRIYTDAPPFKFRLSVADYLTLRDQQDQFEQTATYTDRSMSYVGPEAAELIRARVVSWSFFSLLGIAPAIGRDFTESDGRPGTPPVVVASHGFWQQRLGGRPDSVGRPIKLDGAEYVVVGVLPPRSGPLERRQDVFVIQQFSPPPRKGPFFYSVVARLRESADRRVAADQLRAINRAMFPVWRMSYQDDKATWSMEDLKTSLVGDVETVAGLAMAAVAVVWLIACANASNLLIARVTGRQQELAMRAALGASRGRVIRYLLAESAVLATAAMAVGIGLAWGGIQLLRGVGSTYFPRMDEIALDGSVLSLLGVLAAISAAIFGLIPAWHGTGAVRDSIGTLGRSTTNPAGRRLQRALVASQFAIATPLLVVAGLLLVSLNQLKLVDLGFDGRGMVTGSIRIPAAQYSEPGRINAFWDELRRRLEAVPGVSGVAFADGRPPNSVGNRNNFDLEQFPTPPGQSQPVTPWVAVTPDYFRVLGLTLLEGRLLDERDTRGPNLEAVVVDRAWARRFFPSESAVGKRFREGGCTTCPWTTVVGVVSEVKYAGLDKPDDGTVYSPMAGFLLRYVVVRSGADSAGLLTALRRVVRELEPAAPLAEVATIDELVGRSLERPQSLSWLVASFALVALVLSVVGIYGVMGYYVEQHLKDISIRLALGGSAKDVLWLVVGQGMTVVAAGLLIGLFAAYALTRLGANLLYGVAATDPLTFTGASGLLLLAALIACAAPAWRAMGTQPAAVLRNN